MFLQGSHGGGAGVERVAPTKPRKPGISGVGVTLAAPANLHLSTVPGHRPLYTGIILQVRGLGD